LCAATTSSQPTNEAFEMCRERGRVVMVGAMGMELERTTFYNRELDFVISRSTGPGRYDPDYEERRIDYPIGYVRWTEQRNMEPRRTRSATEESNAGSSGGAEFSVEQEVQAYDVVEHGAHSVLVTCDGEDGIALAPGLLHQLGGVSRPKNESI